MTARLEFVPQDMWVGAYWKRRPWEATNTAGVTIDLWLILVPMLPLHVTWEREWVHPALVRQR